MIDKAFIKTFIKQALQEDVGTGDYTSLATIPSEKRGKAKLLVKENGVLAGVEIAQMVFEEVDPELQVQVFMNDGVSIKVGDIVLEVEGRTHSILIAERLVLNLMQRMSGIATKTHYLTSLIQHTKAKLLDTRKTTPNFRYFEKLAVKIGGGVNHRFGLYDMVLIKDNHVDYAGGISNAIVAANNYLKENNINIPIELEVRSLQELQEVIAVNGNLDRILLDNFSPQLIKEAVALIDGKYVTEASGGINESNIKNYAEAGVDYISVGALTHAIKSLDLSLKAVNI